MSRRTYNSTATRLRREGKKKTPSEEKTGIVYGLYSTENPEHIRYIGATIKTASQRLTQHLSGNTSQKVFQWITESKRQGDQVRIKVLENHPLEGLFNAEVRWTEHYRAIYPDLLNSGLRPHHRHR